MSNYLSHLSAVFTVAGPAWNDPLDERAMRNAMIVAKKLGLTQKSRHRARRPTLDELDQLMPHLACCRFCGHEDKIVTMELESGYDETEV